MTLYEKIKRLCENEGFSISNLGEKIPNLNVSKASVTGWKNGSVPRSDKIKAIADYFGVTTEYLTDDSLISAQTIQDNHGVIGSTHAPITIINGSERTLSEQETALLSIFGKLDVIGQAKLLTLAQELLEKKS